MMVDNVTTSQKSNLSETKRALLAKRLKGKNSARIKTVTIPRLSSNEPTPLSFAQERLWILEQFQPDTAAFNLPFALRLQGDLNLTWLVQSLQTVVARHETLRTVFIKTDGGARQVVQPEMTLDIPLVDLRTYDDTKRDIQVQQFIEQAAKKPFDISQDPLLRLTLLQLADDDHIAVFTMHHIISDGWSVTILLRDLFQAYTAFATDKPLIPPELPIQYRDFAVWQREWLQGDVLDKQLAYWRQQLDQAPAIQTLPTDKPRPEIQTFNSRKHPLRLSPQVSEAAQVLSQQSGVTMFMLLLAGFKLVLSRYLGQTDIVIGTPIANRNRTEVEGLIGMMLNTLVLRTDLSDQPTFHELLQRVRQVSLGAFSHQDLPFEKLVEELSPERHLNYTPLFQTMFNFHNNPEPDFTLPNLKVTPFAGQSEAEKFDLTLSLYEDEGGIGGHISYNTDLFEAETIARLSQHYQTILGQAVLDPNLPISQLTLLTTAEQQQILVDWNQTTADYPNLTLPVAFEHQAEKTPKATALRFANESLTFADLNRRANQMAHYLTSQGVTKGDFVGIYLERSTDMVIALLGILKAGAAYLPLDPTYPAERLVFMLADTDPALLITHTKLSGQFTNFSKPILCLNQTELMLNQQPISNPTSSLTLDDVAYVIYTSGSTGEPKGVLGRHRGAINRFHWMWQTYPFTADEVCSQKTALSFVDSVWEIFGPLLQGIPLVIIPDDTLKDTRLFVQSLAKHRVSRIVLVPSLLRVMLSLYPDLARRLPDLKIWVTSGETISAELARLFTKRMPHSRLINLYGSSEVSADVTYFDLSADSYQATIPIGRPIANTQIYLLDADLNPVPMGVPGHLHAGGVGLAAGYLGRPDLTAERFIHNPFSAEPNSQLYQTGDLARYRTDGVIEFLGRTDHQVKVRGYRIELGEIEQTLNRLPEVNQALIIPVEDTPGEVRLIAYIVPASSDISLDNLKHTLKQQLPAYMIPATFICLDSLPLTPNGKVDRLALLQIKPNQRPNSEVTVTPRNKTEVVLTKIWQSLLPVEAISIHDDFFDLGGHSLLAVQLFDQIEKQLDKSLPLITLIQSPTIAGLAQVIMDGVPNTPPPILVPIQTKGDLPPFFGVHGGMGEVLFYRQLAQHLPGNQPLYAFRRGDKLGDPTAIYRTIEEAATQYLTAMKTIQPHGPYYLGGYCIGGVIAFEMAQQLSAQGEEVALVALIGAGYPPQSARPRLHYLNRLGYHWRNGNLVKQMGPYAKKWLARKTRRLKQHLHEPISASQLNGQKIIPQVINHKARLAYHPKSYNDKLVLFETSQNTVPYWATLSNKAIECQLVSGSHYTMFHEPYVQTLAQKIQLYLKQQPS